MSAPVRASAPLRLDFGGGWTDVEPFASDEGGAVVNGAIGLRMHVEYEPGGSGYRIAARDLDQEMTVASPTRLAVSGPLALHQAALRMLPPGPGALRTRGEVPPGSGLGSSGALDVALVAALSRVRGESPEPTEVAELGWRLETIEAGLAGGRQDQYAAALGGFHRFGFGGGAVVAERLVLDPAFAAELARRTLICYTGRSRLSGETIRRVMNGYAAGDRRIVTALRDLRQIALEMADALRSSAFGDVADLLNRNWECQQQLDPGMRTGEMARLEAAMGRAGAVGGKAAGAGAGGCMFFLMQDDAAGGREAALAAGASVVPSGWSATGVEIC